MGVACLARKAANRFATALILLGSVIIIFLSLWPFAMECRILFGLPFSALVLGAVFLERRKKLGIRHWMVLLGDASYSIYLIHNSLVSVTGRLAGRLHGFATWGLGMVVGVVASVIAGVLYHLLIEKPSIRIFRKTFAIISHTGKV